MKKAFTLIELLVVVLIIGILAAVALPQYQVAVVKSKYIQMMLLGDAIARAEEVYKLANGTYTDNLDELDIEIPGYNSTKKYASGTEYRCYVDVIYKEVYCISLSYPQLRYHVYFYNNSRSCWVGKDNGSYSSILEQVCKSVTGKKEGTTEENTSSPRKVFYF